MASGLSFLRFGVGGCVGFHGHVPSSASARRRRVMHGCARVRRGEATLSIDSSRSSGSEDRLPGPRRDGDSTRRNETPFSGTKCGRRCVGAQGRELLPSCRVQHSPTGCSTAARSRRIGGCGQVMTLASVFVAAKVFAAGFFSRRVRAPPRGRPSSAPLCECPLRLQRPGRRGHRRSRRATSPKERRRVSARWR